MFIRSTDEIAQTGIGRRAVLEELKQYGKRLVKKTMDVPWPIWPILFILLLIFQNKLGEVLRNFPLIRWGLLLLTVLIGIIGIIRIQSK
jgi:hypothetical protein